MFTGRRNFLQWHFSSSLKEQQPRIFTVVVLLELRSISLGCFAFLFFVWVWGFEILHYTVSFEKCFVFGLGCFLSVFRVWTLDLSHIAYVDSMVQCGSVGVGAC
jgi:hypothetical protein